MEKRGNGNTNKDKGKQSSFAKLWNSLPDFLNSLTARIVAVTTLIGAIAGLIALFHGGGTPNPPESGGTNHDLAQPTPTPPTMCEVSGVVYDNDHLPKGLADIQIAYVSAANTNAQPTQIKTTKPDGSFNFSCTQIPAADFPIHLQMTYTWAGGSQMQVVQSEDKIFVNGSAEMSLYLSPSEITNWHHAYALNRAAIMPLSSAKLLHTYNTLSITNNIAHLPRQGISVIPANVRVPRTIIAPP